MCCCSPEWLLNGIVRAKPAHVNILSDVPRAFLRVARKQTDAKPLSLI